MRLALKVGGTSLKLKPQTGEATWDLVTLSLLRAEKLEGKEDPLQLAGACVWGRVRRGRPAGASAVTLGGRKCLSCSCLCDPMK